MNAYQLADRLGVTHTTVYQWVKQGLTHTVKQQGLRKVMRFDIKEVYQWIDENKNGGQTDGR